MSAYVFTAVAGGSLGLLAGGVLTEVLSWHWIFFVNLPIGAVTFALGQRLIPRDKGLGLGNGVDWLGSVLVTTSLGIAVYAIVSATSHGWGSVQVLGFGGRRGRADGGVPGGRVEDREPDHAAEDPPAARPDRRERRARLPGDRHVLDVLPRDPVHGARAPLRGARRPGWRSCPGRSRSRRCRWGIAARMVARFGPRRVLVFGMLVVMGGLTTFHSVGPHTGFFPTIFVACFLIGLGIGSAFMPLLTIAMADVPPADAGLGSGITNVSQQVAGALGLALLSTIATNHTKGLLATHHSLVTSLLAGYHVAFLVGVGAVGIGLLVALVVLRTPEPAKVEAADEVHSIELVAEPDLVEEQVAA